MPRPSRRAPRPPGRRGRARRPTPRRPARSPARRPARTGRPRRRRGRPAPCRCPGRRARRPGRSSGPGTARGCWGPPPPRSGRPRRGAPPPRRRRRAGAGPHPRGSRRRRTTRCRARPSTARSAASRAVCAMPSRPIAARTARTAPRTCGGAAPGAASSARCAVASQRSATSRSPRATRVRREGEGEDGAGRDLLLVEAVQPALDRAGRALPGEGRHGPPQQARRPVGVAGRDRVVERLGQLALLLVPGARAAVDLELHRGVAAPQPGAQRAADERVHAELLLGAVQRRERQARPRQAAQRSPGPATVEDGVAEAAGEPVQRCGALEQREVVGRQPAEDGVLDVVGDDPVVAGEAGHGGAEVALLAQRQAREVQRRGPALGRAGERHRVRRGRAAARCGAARAPPRGRS